MFRKVTKRRFVDIAKSGAIIRYGEIIGYALRDIAKGSWIDESLVELPQAPALETYAGDQNFHAAFRAGRLHL